jgi:PA domain/Secretion system C-terminal sorting domain
LSKKGHFSIIFFVKYQQSVTFTLVFFNFLILKFDMKKIYLLFLSLIVLKATSAQSSAILKIDAPASIAGFVESSNAAGITTPWSGAIGLGQCVTGRLVLVTDGQSPDSIGNRGCNPLTNAAAVNGNIALVRRGDCFFSIKALKAQRAGAKAVVVFNRNAGEGLINMAAGDSSTFVTIPVFFVSFEDGMRMTGAMAAGPVNVSMCNPAFFDATGAYAYATPQKEAKGLDSITVALGNGGNTRTGKVWLSTRIENPLGAVAILRDSIDSIPVNVTYRFRFDRYNFPTPAPVGKYKMTFTNTLTLDTIRSEFIISDYMFAIDNGKPTNGTAIDATRYIDGSLRFDIGSVYYTGTNPDKCTHAAFALHNRDQFTRQDTFSLQLFKLDEVLFNKLRDQTLTYGDLTPIAQKGYRIKGNEPNDSLLVAAWNTPVTLDDNSIYMLMIICDGNAPPIPSGNVPNYSYSGVTSYKNLSTIVYSWNGAAVSPRHVFYSGGWGAKYNNIARLYMQGTRVGVDRNTPALAVNQVKLFPNPTSQDQINLELNLQNTADVLNVTVTDLLGNVLRREQFNNVQNGTFPVNISGLANGTYFLTVVGKEGFRTVHFEVIK